MRIDQKMRGSNARNKMEASGGAGGDYDAETVFAEAQAIFEDTLGLDQEEEAWAAT